LTDNSKVINELKEIIKNRGLKYTKQREVIFETILNSNKHLNAEELNVIISEKYPNLKIGIATIYRALSFLEEVKLISSVVLDNDGKKFESNIKEHHDHIICIKCNKIIEFLSNKIEKAQEDIAKENGFKLLNHTMYLYGVCSKCQ
jgi:Fur family transcriptional regulator, ferric uptake regulator